MCFTHSEEFRFFKSLSSIPVVNSAVNIGSNIYVNLKKWNPYLETTFTATEQMVVYITETPTMISVAQKVEMPVLFVDKLATDGLLMLENKYPSIKMSTDEIKDEAIKQMVILQGVGAKKLYALMQSIGRQHRLGMERAVLFMESLISPKISVYVDVIERTVDNYLPPIEGESNDCQAIVAHKQRVFARIAFIPQTVQQRIVQRYNQFVFRITWTED
jgi:hypothetical protein